MVLAPPLLAILVELFAPLVKDFIILGDMPPPSKCEETYEGPMF